MHATHLRVCLPLVGPKRNAAERAAFSSSSRRPSMEIFRLIAGLCALAVPAHAQSDGASQLLFNNASRTCHSVKQGDNRLGPNLHGIVGRKSGSLKNYAYSD